MFPPQLEVAAEAQLLKLKQIDKKLKGSEWMVKAKKHKQ